MKLYLPNIKSRTALVLAGLIGIVVLVLWGTVQVLVSADDVRDKLIAAVKEASGYDLEVQSASLDVFPLPSIILGQVAITNPSSSTESYLFEASSVQLHLDLPSLFTASPHAYAIDVTQAALNLERYSAKESNWEPLLPLLNGFDARGRQRINFIDGAIYYQDTASNREESVTSLRGYVELNSTGQPQADLRFTAFNEAGTLTLQSTGGQLRSYRDFALQALLELRFGNEYLSYSGKASHTQAGDIILEGSLKAQAEKSRVWFERFSAAKAKEGAFATLPETLPLHLDASFDTHQNKGNITLTDLSFGESRGKGTLKWVERNSLPEVEGEFSFEALNADELLGGEGNINAFFSLFLPQGVEGVFTANAKKLIYQGMPFSGVQLTSSLLQGEMNINQLAAALPGGTRSLAFGIMKRDARGSVNFDGSIEMMGNDAAAFLKDSGFQKVNLIPQANSKFRARANVFLSADRGTISEMRFQGGDFYAVGGVNFNAGGKHDVEMTLRFRNVRLEPLAAFFTPITAKISNTDQRVLDRKLPWLDKINKSFLLNLLFEDFALGAKRGVRSQFIVSLSKGRADFQKIDMNLEQSTVQGAASFDQNGETPMVVADLMLSDYDLNSLLGKNFIRHPVPRGNQAVVWPSEPFETSFLRGYDSQLLIRITHAVHDSFSMDNLTIKATASNGDWQISDLSADIWGGTLSATGQLAVSSVPSLSTAFQMSGIEVAEGLRSLAGFDSLRGRASLSADFKSSGISASDFVRNASGTLAFSGRDITIRGFDIASLVQAVPVARSVADVVNTTRIATLKGASSFNIVDGGFYFSQGNLGTQGITFRSRHALGSFGGTIDLMRWMLNAQIQFRLISIVSEEFPTVAVIFRDSMDNPMLDLDTRSLEAWVARQKLLQ